MALDNAALLEVLEAMQAAGVEDRVRTAARPAAVALRDALIGSLPRAGADHSGELGVDQRLIDRLRRRPDAVLNQSCSTMVRCRCRCWRGCASATCLATAKTSYRRSEPLGS